ncbi:hypothetical protein [Aestuariimicrobium ganziense]|uniref:hypothetical protein n=1 Tax=Aestuariimicrobium ganziense TaxID=2773677 RepID=UPI001944497A|nr:hypothetical protein [Aestuariimicrobium ganziense]
MGVFDKIKDAFDDDDRDDVVTDENGEVIATDGHEADIHDPRNSVIDATVLDDPNRTVDDQPLDAKGDADAHYDRASDTVGDAYERQEDQMRDPDAGFGAPDEIGDRPAAASDQAMDGVEADQYGDERPLDENAPRLEREADGPM